MPLLHRAAHLYNSALFSNSKELWLYRYPMNRYTEQARFIGINPWDDDDEHDDTTTELDDTKINNEQSMLSLKKLRDNIPVKPKLTDKIKRFEVPDRPPPGPIKNLKTEQECFFQFDYRNVPTPTDMRPELIVLFDKIRLTLENTELEPYHVRRGCETLRRNIDNLPSGTKFRVGGAKKSLEKVGDGYNKAVDVTTHRALRKSMFYLLWERHAIMTSGTTHEWKRISSKEIGQSLLGPDTRVIVDQQLGKDIIQDLWLRGVSAKYNRLMERHDNRSADMHYEHYLKPKPSRKEIARMDWNTDLKLKSTERINEKLNKRR